MMTKGMPSTNFGLRTVLVSAAVCLCFATVSAAETRRIDLQARRLARIEPGTVIAESPPEGWTHLILKNLPHLDAAEANKVHSLAAGLADKLFAVVVARVDSAVTPNGRIYWIRQIAIGLGTNIAGRDTIIDTDSQATLGADFGIIARTVLSRSEEELDRWHVVARSDTLAVVDSPTRLAIGGRHYDVIIRLFVTLDGSSGQVSTLFCALQDTQSGRRMIGNSSRWLPPNLVNRYPLKVDANQVLVGVPNSAAFAMGGLPSGVALSQADAFAEILAQPRYAPEAFARLESALATAAVASSTPLANETRRRERPPLAPGSARRLQ